MSKRKSFKTWYEEDEWGERTERKPTNRDGKRNDSKKKAIQKARRQKNRAKQSFFNPQG